MDAERAVRRALRPWAEQHGFALQGRSALVRRVPEDVLQRIDIASRRASGARGASLPTRRVHVAIGVWLGPVEAVLSEVFADSSRHVPLETTVRVDLDRLAGRDRPRHLDATDDAPDIARTVAADLEAHALDWLDRVSTLDGAASELGDRLGTVSEQERWLVVAAMRGDLDGPWQSLRPRLAKSPRFTRADFSALHAHLEKRFG